jgi:outer membrane protein assembly factor BamA
VRSSRGWVVLPGMWASTDRGVGMSAVALHYFPLQSGALRPSEVGVTGIVTTEGDNVLRAEPVLRFDQDRYRLEADLEVARRAGVFYGIGNEAALADAEDYRRLRLAGRGRLSRRIADSVYLGLAWDSYWSSALEADADSMLMNGSVPGTEAGTATGIGVVAQRDTRDHLYAPTRGSLLEATAYVYDQTLGGDYDFATFHANTRTYLEVAPEHVLALQVRGDFRAGQAPFDRLPMAGDATLLRGIQGGRFRDQHFLGGQVEYRSPMLWRVGAVMFAATGRVAPTLAALAEPAWKLASGGGLRVALKRADRVNARVDIGFSRDGYEIYVQLREAF